MDKETLAGLQRLNQLALTSQQEDDVISFFQTREEEWQSTMDIDTSNVERMVHVMPLETIVREDVIDEPFSREDLQAGAPDAMDGYWQVPCVVE